MQNVALKAEHSIMDLSNKPGKFERFWSNFFNFFYGPFIKVNNIENYEDFAPAIFVFNHSTTFETVLIYNFLLKNPKIKRRVSFIIDWMYAHIPFIGKFIRVIDPILVYNKKAKIKKLNQKKIAEYNIYEESVRRLKLGKSVGMYPEGTRNRDPENLKRGRKGIGKIALESGISVIPIGVDFPKRIKKNKIPKLGRIILNIGKKIDFSNEVDIANNVKNDLSLSETEKSKIIKHLEAKITYEVMQSLSGLCGKKYPYNLPAVPEIAKRYLP